MNLDVFSVPKKYAESHSGVIDGCLYLYNPLSLKGLALLNQEAQVFYDYIDNTRNLSTILKLAKEQDPNITQQDVIEVFESFLESDIIYFDQPKAPKDTFISKPTQLGVWMHITNQCNLRCKYCYVNKTSEVMSKEVAETATKNIFRDAKRHGFKHITFKFSGGEALLELSTILFVTDLAKKLAKETGLEVEFVVLSNGVLITEEVAKTLKENGIRASISLDGTEKYHDAQRVFANGSGSFKFAIKGLENLLAQKVPFNVSVTITNKNAENLPELTKYLLDKDIPFAFNFYRENPYVTEDLYGEDEKLVEYVKKAYEVIHNNVPKNSLLAGILDRINFVHPHRHTCGVGNSYIVVRHDGTMVSCQMTLEQPIGDVFHGDLVATMENECFIEPKGLTVEGKTPCNTCMWRYICCGGCPLLTKEHKGVYTANSPYCAVYKELIPEVLKLEAKRLLVYGINK